MNSNEVFEHFKAIIDRLYDTRFTGDLFELKGYFSNKLKEIFYQKQRNDEIIKGDWTSNLYGRTTRAEQLGNRVVSMFNNEQLFELEIGITRANKYLHFKLMNHRGSEANWLLSNPNNVEKYGYPLSGL